MTQQDFGLSLCPICEDGTVYWPVTSWGEGYNWEYGGIEYNPDFDEPFCSNGCYLAKDAQDQAYPPDDFVTLDVDENGKPI